MAWQAYLASRLTLDGTSGSLVNVWYYDDADPANIGAGLVGPGNGTAAASTDLVSITAHGLVAGNQVIFTAVTGGAGIVLDNPYFVLATGLTANVFAVSDRPGGTAVDITSNATAITAFKLTPPKNVLHAKVWTLPVGQVLADLLPQIDQVGKDARALYQAQTAPINSSVPVGTIRPVPA